ncbi:PH domain-containing protein [Calidifontibacter sp. DB0510]|uniref:PH domain-containing protein n=1 Tax=Metallococcus carri TaxID=1656884 RepID=A0A967AXU8_9MICO|nr:PH domain-containing protein [Metallococcus carri]NHN54989.1 PH domain-containing protein [Metallococcus carri]NOP37335.1 PH domain-containing protein [Calidifontibacter sp. DB2511S]
MTGQPYAVFRPRRGRYVAWGAAVLIVICFTVLGFVMPRDKGGVANQLAFVIFGLLIAAVLSRFARVRAVPSERGLVVHNLLVTRELEWAEILDVQFGGGPPWLLLDLADTEQLAVMGVQRADGEYAVREAQRLAALVEAHSSSDRD